MSLLTMVSNAMLRQNLSAPVSVIASPDTGVIQRLALLQDIGDELAERINWQALNIPATIVGDGATTLFPFPAGFGGMSQGMKFQSTLFPLLPLAGPVTNEQMAAFKALPITPIQPIWRVIGGSFEFFPAPASGEVYTYNYYSTLWIKPATGPLALTWANDTDVSLIDEKILTTGLEWRWLKSKKLDYSEEFRRYEMRIARADGRDDDAREVSMSRRLRGWGNTWPGQISIIDGSIGGSFDGSFSIDFS